MPRNREAHLQQQIRLLDLELQRLQAEVAQYAGKLAQKEAALAGKEAALAEVLASRCWRLTWPLRLASRVVKDSLRRLAHAARRLYALLPNSLRLRLQSLLGR